MAINLTFLANFIRFAEITRHDQARHIPFEKPSHSKALNAFSEMEVIEKRYIINKNLNTTDRSVKFFRVILQSGYN